MDFWHKIQSLPEPARKMLAVFLIIIAAVSVFWISGGFISSRLAVISPGPQLSAPPSNLGAPLPSKQTAEPEQLSPFAGIIDTLKSIEKLWKY